MKYLGLFEGIGVFALAAQKAGATIEQLVEIDPFRQQILAKNFPTAAIHGDIKTYAAGDHYDIICGGFPCTDISTANTKGKGLQGSRSGLWFEMLRVITEAKPRYVCIENVPPTGNGDRHWVNTAKPALESLGYTAERLNLSAAQFGACHNRSRTFLVAYSNKERWAKLPQSINDGIKERVFSRVCTGKNPHYNRPLFWRLPNGEILRRDDGVAAWLGRYFQRDKPSLAERKRIAALGDSIYLPCAEYALKYCLGISK
jgi:DNA (cytosine-5)-methyltransferase 1